MRMLSRILSRLARVVLAVPSETSRHQIFFKTSPDYALVSSPSLTFIFLHTYLMKANSETAPPRLDAVIVGVLSTVFFLS